MSAPPDYLGAHGRNRWRELAPVVSGPKGLLLLEVACAAFDRWRAADETFRRSVAQLRDMERARLVEHGVDAADVDLRVAKVDGLFIRAADGKFEPSPFAAEERVSREAYFRCLRALDISAPGEAVSKWSGRLALIRTAEERME